MEAKSEINHNKVLVFYSKNLRHVRFFLISQISRYRLKTLQVYNLVNGPMPCTHNSQVAKKISTFCTVGLDFNSIYIITNLRFRTFSNHVVLEFWRLTHPMHMMTWNLFSNGGEKTKSGRCYIKIPFEKQRKKKKTKNVICWIR